MAGITDTSPDVERLMLDCYRRMPPERKVRNLAADFRFARALHAAGLRRRRPDATNSEIVADWLASALGRPCPVPVPEGVAMDPDSADLQPVLRHTTRTLDRLGLAYAIGGSVASSLHGVNRHTRDADLTVEPFPGREAEFAAVFPPPDYFAHVDAIRDAVRRRSTFNILHFPSGYKVDVFIRKDDPFEASAFARRGPYSLPDRPDEPLMVHSPEDVVLFKLRWYRMGNEVSEKQWTDITTVMRIQTGRLDDAYLDRWAADIGVADLLARARHEIGG